MKITVSLEEAKSCIRLCLKDKGIDIYNRDMDIEIVTSDPIPTQNQKYLDIINQIKKLEYWGADKIQAVKYFRNETGAGLAQSKWAIENFGLVIGFFNKHGRLPVM